MKCLSNHPATRRTKAKENDARIQTLEHRLTVLFRQVIASALIFLLIYVGGGLLPEGMVHLFSSVHQLISSNEPLLTSTEAMGQAVGEGIPWQTAVQDWCVETFLPQHRPDTRTIESYLDHSAEYHANLIPNGPYRPAAHPISLLHDSE